MLKVKLTTNTTLKEMLLHGLKEKDSIKLTIRNMMFMEMNQIYCGKRTTMDCRITTKETLEVLKTSQLDKLKHGDRCCRIKQVSTNTLMITTNMYLLDMNIHMITKLKIKLIKQLLMKQDQNTVMITLIWKELLMDTFTEITDMLTMVKQVSEAILIQTITDIIKRGQYLFLFY